MNNFYSLSQITDHIQKLISKTYILEYWIKAEIAQLNFYPKSGHCYPDLVEKSELGVKAQIRGIIWRGNFQFIQEKFKNTTGRELTDGMEILFKAKIDFSPNHGLSLNITDIDPNFTLGKMAAQKLQTIKILKDEGNFFKNKTHKTPFFPKRIAVISVETSKGFQDFKKIIDNNSRGYHFFYMLFPALLQGDEAIDSIGRQLERIKKVKQHFDLVAIIRGGGGDVGLSCYNDLELARMVANFPLPVFSGIGHSTNETVVEMVSHKNAITPTDLAYFLQQQFDNLAVTLNEFYEKIQNHLEVKLKNQEKNLYRLGEKITSKQSLFLANKSEHLESIKIRLLKYGQKYTIQKNDMLYQKSLKIIVLPTKIIERKNENLDFYKTLIGKTTAHLLKQNWQKTHHQEEKIKILDPIEILKKGFSITRFNGKAITNKTEIAPNSVIETQLATGKIKSKTL